jgi:hypothetical protein
MGISDQFRDKAEELAEQAKNRGDKTRDERSREGRRPQSPDKRERGNRSDEPTLDDVQDEFDDRR